MATELYDLTIPVLIRNLRNLSAILDKAATYAETQGIDPTTLTQARLAEDMAPLIKQIQFVSDTAKGAAVRIGGLDPVPMADTESSFPELQDRIARTIAFLESVPREKIDGREDAEVILQTSGGALTFTARNYALGFVLPNSFFHVTTAYALLRQAGVPLGKLDYLGPITA
jgi:hypothetical protein